MASDHQVSTFKRLNVLYLMHAVVYVSDTQGIVNHSVLVNQEIVSTRKIKKKNQTNKTFLSCFKTSLQCCTLCCLVRSSRGCASNMAAPRFYNTLMHRNVSKTQIYISFCFIRNIQQCKLLIYYRICIKFGTKKLCLNTFKSSQTPLLPNDLVFGCQFLGTSFLM